MITLEELEAEAAERYPIHDEDGCSCWCEDCKKSRVERRVYVQSKTVPLDRFEEACALHIYPFEGDWPRLSREWPGLAERTRRRVRSLLEVAGFYVPEPEPEEVPADRLIEFTEKLFGPLQDFQKDALRGIYRTEVEGSRE